MSKSRFARVWALGCLLISLNSSVLAQGARVNPSGADSSLIQGALWKTAKLRFPTS